MTLAPLNFSSYPYTSLLPDSRNTRNASCGSRTTRRSRMIWLRKPWSGSSPATYPRYFPFIGAFPHAGRQSDGIEQRGAPSPYAWRPRHVTFTAPLPRQRLVVHLRYIAVPGGVRQEGGTQRLLEMPGYAGHHCWAADVRKHGRGRRPRVPAYRSAAGYRQDAGSPDPGFQLSRAGSRVLIRACAMNWP